MIPGPLDEGLERRLFLLGEVVANSRSARPQNPVEIGGEKRGAVGSGRVKREQVAIQPGRFNERRTAVGDGWILLWLPGEKLLGRAEGGRISCKFEDVFGLDHAPLARRGEFECVAHDHVPYRGPVGIGHRAWGDERGPLSHRQLLQCRRLGKRRGKPAADLANDCGQVPRCDRREIVGRRRPRRALGKPPTVLLEEAPGPVGLDRLEHGLRFGRRLLDRSGQLHEPLGVVRRPVTRRREHARGDRPGSLGPRLVLHGGLLDAGERLRGRLRLALVDRLLHPFPRLGPWPHWNVVRRVCLPHAIRSPRTPHEHRTGHDGRHAPTNPNDAHAHGLGPPVANASHEPAKSTRGVVNSYSPDQERKPLAKP